MRSAKDLGKTYSFQYDARIHHTMISSPVSASLIKNDGVASSLSLLDAALCAYLALPLLIFCAWFQWPVAIALAALALYGLFKLFADARLKEFEVSPVLVGVVVVVSMAWTALTGTGHFFYANIDWVTRDAVLRDLTATAWPPSYEIGSQFPLILRAPVGYYLPAAVVGWLTNPRVGDLALYAWSVIGFTLFLSAATTLFSTTRQRVICCLVLVGFGGMDLVGWFVVTGSLPHPGEHLEWWARFAQYSSNSTLWFWVPNHALPAWLGVLLILRHWRRPAIARLAPLMAAAIPLWSPLAAIGLAPFFLAGMDWRRDYRRLIDVRAGLPLLSLAALIARYLTLDAETIPSGWAFANEPLGEFMTVYVPFCVIEFGALAWVLLRMRVYDARLALGVVILLVLPLYRFGPGNDLAMRSSIPALTVLALATVRPLADRAESGWWYLLLAIVTLGALGAAQEPARALLLPRWELTGRTLRETVDPGMKDVPITMPSNYVARLNQLGLAALLRKPTLVQPYAASAPGSIP